MRNLKKFLALALAMVMALSLMVTGASAKTSFPDDAEITEAYREGVEVLTGLKVFKGRNNGADTTFAPKETITRAEVAAILYRLVTGDVDDKNVKIFAQYAKFPDVIAKGENYWAAGYIGYCANAEYIVGDGVNFYPDQRITGYQALAMILRAVGYDQNKEFQGDSWQVRVSSTARSRQMLNNITDGLLVAEASREMVAEILFQAANIQKVNYSNALGYSIYKTFSADPVEINENDTLAWENFKMYNFTGIDVDQWGRPGHEWWTNCTREAKNNAWVYSHGTYSSKLCYFADKPLASYTTAVRECDVWDDAGYANLKSDRKGGNNSFIDLTLYVNGTKDGAVTNEYRILSTDTTTKVGAQGRVTEFYKDRAVMIDTFLARVTNTTPRVLDKAGHVITPSYLYLTVYDGAGKFGGNASISNAEVIKAAKDKDWEYTTGTMLLVNAYTCHTTRANANPAAHGGSDRLAVGVGAQPATETDKNAAAYESEVVRGTRNPVNPTMGQRIEDGENVFIKSVAEPQIGKQTALSYYNDTHTKDGTEYKDALELHLDEAGNRLNTDFAWYFDDIDGNLIGIGPVTNNIKYGIITSMRAVQNVESNATNGTTSAVLTVRYSDDTTETVTVNRFLMGYQDTDASGTVSATDTILPDGTVMTPLANTAEFLPIYDNGGVNVLDIEARTGSATDAVVPAWLHISPATNVNSTRSGTPGGDPWGILTTNATDDSNLFRFVTTTDGTVAALEVAGTSGNTLAFRGLRNGDGAGATLYKNPGHITLTTPQGTAGRTTVYVNNTTKFIVRNEINASINVYDGVDKLPNNLVISGTYSEVDWVDDNEDGVADVLYATGTFNGNVTFGLFYFNGDADGDYTTTENAEAAARFDGTNRYVKGWLNGEFKELQVNNAANFDTIRAGVDTRTYSGHLFAVRMVDGVITDILRSASQGGTPYILRSAPYAPETHVQMVAGLDAVANIDLDGNGAGTDTFGLGGSNGNSYSHTPAGSTTATANSTITGIAHYRVVTDNTSNIFAGTLENGRLVFAPGIENGNAIPAGLGYVAADHTYHFSNTAIKYGAPENLNWNAINGEPRVSDVTIVFDVINNNGAVIRTVRELYIDTEQPGNTPDRTVTSTATITDIGTNFMMLDYDVVAPLATAATVSGTTLPAPGTPTAQISWQYRPQGSTDWLPLDTTTRTIPTSLVAGGIVWTAGKGDFTTVDYRPGVAVTNGGLDAGALIAANTSTGVHGNYEVRCVVSSFVATTGATTFTVPVATSNIVTIWV